VAVPQVLPVLGWRGSFVVCGVVSLLLAIVVGLVVRESPEFTPRKTRMPTGSSSGVFARENRRVNIGTWTCFFCYTVVAYAVAAWAPVFLTTAGMALPEALHSVLIFNICAVVTAITAGFVVMRIGSKWMIGVCSALLLAAITVLLFALQPQGVVTAPRFTLVPIAFGVIGATTGTTLALLATILALAYPPAYRATGIGIGAMIGRCGGILIALTGGAILSLRGDDPTPLFLTLLVATVIAFVAMLVIDRHVPASSGIH
jgi:AAHS family 4-hydroxybenzoate transporter-like MFS transporter